MSSYVVGRWLYRSLVEPFYGPFDNPVEVDIAQCLYFQAYTGCGFVGVMVEDENGESTWVVFNIGLWWWRRYYPIVNINFHECVSKFIYDFVSSLLVDSSFFKSDHAFQPRSFFHLLLSWFNLHNTI